MEKETTKKEKKEAPASVWATLNEVNVSEHIEKRPTRGRDLSYLSWAWAWSELKKYYPNAVARVYENPEGWPYWTDGKTAWVKVSVEIEGLENIEYYPIMDNSHNSIPAEKITSWHVNCAIQRGQTKCIARHGLGMYIYAGEDLPQADVEAEKEFNDRVTKLIAEINKCKTLEEMEALFNENEEMKNVKVFRAAINSRAKQLGLAKKTNQNTNQ